MNASRPAADLGYLLNRAARQLRSRLAERLARLGLTPQQAAVLMAIARSPGKRLAPRVIATSIDTDQATMSGLLDRLARDGWLSMSRNPDDGRSRLATLTEKAIEALPTVMREAEGVSALATERLSEEELRTLRELLTRLGDEANTASRQEGFE